MLGLPLGILRGLPGLDGLGGNCLAAVHLVAGRGGLGALPHFLDLFLVDGLGRVQELALFLLLELLAFHLPALPLQDAPGVRALLDLLEVPAQALFLVTETPAGRDLAVRKHELQRGLVVLDSLRADQAAQVGRLAEHIADERLVLQATVRRQALVDISGALGRREPHGPELDARGVVSRQRRRFSLGILGHRLVRKSIELGQNFLGCLVVGFGDDLVECSLETRRGLECVGRDGLGRRRRRRSRFLSEPEKIRGPEIESRGSEVTALGGARTARNDGLAESEHVFLTETEKAFLAEHVFTDAHR